MLRAATASLHTHLLAAFPAEQAHSPEVLAAEGMPAAICHFLEQTLAHRADMQTRQLASSWFDAQHPDVQPARKAFVRALAAHGQIPGDKWSPTTQQVIRQLLSYLVRPVPTLLNFVFQGKRTTLSAGTVLQRMGYFAPYPYLRDALRDDVEGDLQQGVDRERLAAVLRPADRAQTETYAPGDWADHFAPLFALYALVDQDHPPVPTELLCAAFEDKTMEHLAERLRSTENEHFTQKALREVLEQPRTLPPPAPADDPVFAPEADVDDSADMAPGPNPQNEQPPVPQNSRNARTAPTTDDADAPLGKPAPAPEASSAEASSAPAAEAPPRPKPAPSDPAAADVPKQKAPTPEAPADAKPSSPAEEKSVEEKPAERADPEPAPSAPARDEPKPLWQRFQRATADAPAEGPPADNTSDRPRWQQFAPTGGDTSRAASAQRDAEIVRTEPIDPLERRLLGEKASKHRDFFVETLFQGSPQRYHAVLQRLDAADSWAEASQIIASDVFRAHSVNIYSDPAVLFTDLIEARFRQNT